VPFYDGSFNCRFHFAAGGLSPRRRKCSKGGVRRRTSSFGVPLPPPKGVVLCVKVKRKQSADG